MKTWTNEQLIDAVKTSKKFVEVAQKLGLTNLGSNYNTIKKYINQLNLDTSHFLSRSEICSAARENIKPLTDGEIFCVNRVDRKIVKNRIIKEGLMEYECHRCGITTWDGETLSLHLDHINGINNDNRLENLRFLCPNCHSLTDTYCAKNKSYDPETRIMYNCESCGKEITYGAKHCKNCSTKNRATKIEWPDDAALLSMVAETNYSRVGEQLGVSANSVKKRLYNKGLLT